MHPKPFRFMLAVASAAVSLVASASLDPVLALGEKATAEIKLRNGTPAGTVTLTETMAGVLMSIKLTGLPAGPHGFRVHDAGSCEGDFSSAGAIYNPLGAKHGFLNDEGPMAGDLTNLIVAPTGNVEVELLAPFITLSKASDEGLFDGNGSALVIFEKSDDYLTDPDGDAGDRIACGIIKPAS
jgi:Cu-Zn family superoxide dismutase